MSTKQTSNAKRHAQIRQHFDDLVRQVNDAYRVYEDPTAPRETWGEAWFTLMDLVPRLGRYLDRHHDVLAERPAELNQETKPPATYLDLDAAWAESRRFVTWSAGQEAVDAATMRYLFPEFHLDQEAKPADTDQ